ncbi:MAG: hypothetical protein U1E65_06315 [Myxococcota bacterium]
MRNTILGTLGLLLWCAPIWAAPPPALKASTGQKAKAALPDERRPPDPARVFRATMPARQWMPQLSPMAAVEQEVFVLRVVDGTVLAGRSATLAELSAAKHFGFHEVASPALVADRTIWKGQVFRLLHLSTEGPSEDELEHLVGTKVTLMVQQRVPGTPEIIGFGK